MLSHCNVLTHANGPLDVVGYVKGMLRLVVLQATGSGLVEWRESSENWRANYEGKLIETRCAYCFVSMWRRTARPDPLYRLITFFIFQIIIINHAVI